VCKWCATYHWKKSRRWVTTLLPTSSQMEVCMRSYVPPKSQECQLWEFRDPHLGVMGQKAIWMWPPVERRKIYYKGEGGGFPQVQAVVSLMSPSCPWLVLTPKVLQLCTNHLVLLLCRFVWVIEACQFFLVPSWSSSTALYPSKVPWIKERAPTPYFFDVFSLGSHLSPSRSWERVMMCGSKKSSITLILLKWGMNGCWKRVLLFGFL
jgi:hypothetical protein